MRIWKPGDHVKHEVVIVLAHPVGDVDVLASSFHNDLPARKIGSVKSGGRWSGKEGGYAKRMEAQDLGSEIVEKRGLPQDEGFTVVRLTRKQRWRRHTPSDRLPATHQMISTPRKICTSIVTTHLLLAVRPHLLLEHGREHGIDALFDPGNDQSFALHHAVLQRVS